MKIITEAEFTKTFEDVMAEAFEIIGKQAFYLEVLSNEVDYVGSLVEYGDSNIGLYNASGVFELDAETHKYAYQQAIDRGDAKQTFFAYDDYADAVRHGFELLKLPN